MKTTIEVELKPFGVPNFVIDLNADDPNKSGIHLSRLSPDTLETMCNEFRESVFKVAGKQRPPQPACSCGR